MATHELSIPREQRHESGQKTSRNTRFLSLMVTGIFLKGGRVSTQKIVLSSHLSTLFLCEILSCGKIGEFLL